MRNSVLTSPRQQNFEAHLPSDKKQHLKSSVCVLQSEPRKIFSRHPRTAFDFLARQSKQIRNNSREKAKKGNHLIKLLNGALTSLLHLEEKGRQKKHRDV
ncbi:hypothetical protein CDAR_409661 [Caerostris darwini]|uniref:Uncharacterized protein n=1 Tax=Caerostris darwini TaxID=1538125 RepID=A0AAV4UK48_9ARAC|nr:hypothetical protein CDAR_409661 [Caerostris darwini]